MIVLVCFYQLHTFIIFLFINYVIIADIEDGDGDGGGGEAGGRDDLGEGEGFYFILFLKLG